MLRSGPWMPPVPTRPHFPQVRGRCPSCGTRSLFLAEDDYVTCGWIECTDPTAACDLLEGGPS